MTKVDIPKGVEATTINVGGKKVALTNLNKIFWPDLKLTKRDLIQYYADVADVLLPHLKDRGIVMKRYPNGITGEFFFMKRTPAARPPWIKTCAIEHGHSVIDFPMAPDVASLLWLINLGCIDLNQWYGMCDDPDKPDYLHFDLDPEDAPYDMVLEVALVLRDTLQALGMTVFAKTSGNRGMHLYVGIKRGPAQHEVWALTKRIAHEIARSHSDIMTVVYKKANRPKGVVHVDYNQNRSGATLASIYSVRPNPYAGVSMPVTWQEIDKGVKSEDFTMLNAVKRISKTGDLWKPLTQARGRFDLSPLLG